VGLRFVWVYDIRQPRHFSISGNLGLGIFDQKLPKGPKLSIDHRVVMAGKDKPGPKSVGIVQSLLDRASAGQ
jgi:hypothetical protein